MPIYEYSCLNCHTQFEKFVRSMAVAGEIQCPHCGSTEVKKGWSVFGLGKGAGVAGSFAAPAAGGCDTGGT